MPMFKGICTDYVSDIDRLFHASDRPSGKVSRAKQKEIANARWISRLRDEAPETDAVTESPSLWEGF